MQTYIDTRDVGMRMSEHEELLGADLIEHNVKQSMFATKLEEAFMTIAQKENISDIDNILQTVGRTCVFWLSCNKMC